MSKTTVSNLALATEMEFAFLAGLGFELEERREFASESYRGGFEFTFRGSSGEQVTVLYSDCEFEVHANGDEVFGALQHDSFAGNMFSREHLIGALPKIRQSIEGSLRSFASSAT